MRRRRFRLLLGGVCGCSFRVFIEPTGDFGRITNRCGTCLTYRKSRGFCVWWDVGTLARQGTMDGSTRAIGYPTDWSACTDCFPSWSAVRVTLTTETLFPRSRSLDRGKPSSSVLALRRDLRGPFSTCQARRLFGWRRHYVTSRTQDMGRTMMGPAASCSGSRYARR